MAPLEKMIESCNEFSKNPKVGNIEFEVLDARKVCFILKKKKIKLTFFYDMVSSFWVDANILHNELQPLTATTAQEAAAEALELCRKEAKKLVDFLSEPKEAEKEKLNYTSHFLSWRDKYFEPAQRILNWAEKDSNNFYSSSDLENYYKRAYKMDCFQNIKNK